MIGLESLTGGLEDFAFEDYLNGIEILMIYYLIKIIFNMLLT